MDNILELDDAMGIRRLNSEIVCADERCQKAIASIKEIEKLLIQFGFLSFGRDFVMAKSKVVSLQRISTSLELTMGSIISCCESGCIADANALLRKYRDDIFFYLYIMDYDSMYKLGVNSEGLLDMEKQIDLWLKNNLRNLKINKVLKTIASSPSLTDAVNTYNLEASFDEMGRKLNNHVHSNGYWYYNQNANAYERGALASKMASIADDAKYITVVFLFLLILCSPLSVMSEDYIDALECNKTPPEGSQYWVAPFIQEFIRENLSMIDENCIEYLKAHSNMEV